MKKCFYIYVLIWKYIYVHINKKNLYTILKNTYIRFEDYDMSTRMNDDEQMLVDGH
jgi:hypothetical protein